MPPSNSRGFTLIELMVTLAVVVVLAMLAIPSFKDLIDKSRLRGATDDIVNLLNTARVSAIKLQRDVNVSIASTSSTSPWCAGAVQAAEPTSIGDPMPEAAACDCNATTVACIVDDRNTVVSSTSYSGATLQGLSTAIKYSSGSSGEGITFDSKLGSLDITSLPTNPIMTVVSPTKKYKTQISISPLGQVNVCTPTSSPFVSGYPSC